MRYANWISAATVAVGLSLLHVGGMAQLKVDAKGDDVPKGKALGVSGDEVPKGKAFGLKGEVPQGKALGTEKRAAADERREERAARRETERVPVIDANAGTTFRSTQLIGTAITDSEGRTIGKIVDLITDARGNVLFSIISIFGSPGFTGKLFAIPATGFQFQAGANSTLTAQLAFDPMLLRNAPSFTSTRFPDFSDQTFLNELRTFFASILPASSTVDRRTALDPTVPANGPGDRVRTQDEAGTPTLPVDPTLPANGPGDRPAVVNPALPRTGAPAPATPTDTASTRELVTPATPPRAGTVAPSDAATSRELVTPATPPRAGTISPSVPLASRELVTPATPPRAGATAAAADTSAVARTSATTRNSVLRSTQMIGATVQDRDGNSVGEIVDFVSNPNGHALFAIVSLSGEGSTGRLVAIPFGAMTFQSGTNGASIATIKFSSQALASAPSFTSDRFPNFMDTATLDRLRTFFSRHLPAGTLSTDAFNVSGETRTATRTSTGRIPGSPPAPLPGETEDDDVARTPPWPSVPIPPGGPVPRPEPIPDKTGSGTTTPETTTPKTAPKTTPKTAPKITPKTTPPITPPSTTPGSKGTPGTKAFPGAAPTAPGKGLPGGPGVPGRGAPEFPGAPGVPGTGVPGSPAAPGTAPGGGAGGTGGSTSGSGTSGK